MRRRFCSRQKWPRENLKRLSSAAAAGFIIYLLISRYMESDNTDPIIQLWFSSNNTFRSIPILDNITRKNEWFPQLAYFKQMKNPCFLASEEGITRFNCLPYFYLAGFPRCATSTFYIYLQKHQHVIKTSAKEAHFWDNLRWIKHCVANVRLITYAKLLGNFYWTSFVEKCYQHKSLPQGKQCPFILGDYTPRTVYDAEWWQSSNAVHNSSHPPGILTPHKIHKLMASAPLPTKIVFLLRNPRDALFSFYKYSFGPNGSPEHFHFLVTQGAEWWKSCIKILPEKSCAYNLYFPPELRGHVTDLTRLNKTDDETFKILLWRRGSATIMRIFCYVIYITDWLGVFSHQNVLVLDFEHFVRDPLSVMSSLVLPFLGLDNYTQAVMHELTSLPVQKNRNKEVYSYQSLEKTDEMLRMFYRPYNLRLAALLNDRKYVFT